MSRVLIRIIKICHDNLNHSGADFKNNFGSSTIKRCNCTLVASHVTSFNQSGCIFQSGVVTSVTRSGALLDFVQIFKAFYHFSSKIILGPIL